MSWARLDDKFPRHPKIAGLTDREFRVHVTAICYCAEYATGGVIPSTAAKTLGITPKIKERLVQLGLWENGGGVYEIHDFAAYNPKDPTGAARKRRQREREDDADNGNRSDDDIPF